MNLVDIETSKLKAACEIVYNEKEIRLIVDIIKELQFYVREKRFKDAGYSRLADAISLELNIACPDSLVDRLIRLLDDNDEYCWHKYFTGDSDKNKEFVMDGSFRGRLLANG